MFQQANYLNNSERQIENSKQPDQLSRLNICWSEMNIKCTAAGKNKSQKIILTRVRPQEHISFETGTQKHITQ